MNTILRIISAIISPAIGLLGVWILYTLIRYSQQLKKLEASVLSLLSSKKTMYYKDPKTLQQKQMNLATIERSEVNDKKAEFDTICAKYTVSSMIIPVFPLLGILGTVAGLIKELGAASNPELIYSALGVAMWSTFWGLIAAIVLKIVETVTVQSHIGVIENYFSNYDQSFTDSKNIEEASLED